MKHIVKTTNYWLFKPVNPNGNIYYVRTLVEGLAPVWFMGYENHIGLVSSVGGDLKEETKEILEREWQAQWKLDMEDYMGMKTKE